LRTHGGEIIFMAFHDFLADSQSNACPRIFILTVDTLKGLKNLLQVPPKTI
jgi:hypothetical protein